MKPVSVYKQAPFVVNHGHPKTTGSYFGLQITVRYHSHLQTRGFLHDIGGLLNLIYRVYMTVIGI